MTGGLLRLGVAAAASAAVLGVGATLPPPAARAPAPAPQQVPVVGATLVCLGAGEVTVAAEPAGSTVTVGPVGGASTALDLAPGAAAVPADGEVPVVVEARGAAAAGLVAERAGRACAPPATSTWLTGATTASTLLLANVDRDEAVVDIALWSAEGPVDPRTGRGLVVPARGSVRVRLDTLAPGRTGLALSVTATRGRVAAGTANLPAAAAPATRAVVTGLPGGPGSRTVLVTNPGADSAVVRVEVTGGDGQFVPAGLDALTVPAGTTVSADLTDALAASPASVTVTSSGGPVLAAGSTPDAVAGAAAPLTEPALLAGGRPDDTLLLSALVADAEVVLTPLAGSGPRTVTVLAGSTVALPLGDVLPGGGALTVAASGGPVAGARVRPLGAPRVLALRSLVLTVPAPVVVADPLAGLPDR